MSEEKECNQVLKGLCNCKCVKNGTYPCFIEKEFLLKQQLQTAKKENLSLQRSLQMGRITDKEFNIVYKEYPALSQQNKQMRENINLALIELKDNKSIKALIIDLLEQALNEVNNEE